MVNSIDGYSSLSPAWVGVFAAAIGGGAGYAVAPGRYNLQDLLTQNQDTFKKTFSDDVMKFVSDSGKQSVNKITEARKVLDGGADIAKMLKDKTLKADYKNIKGLLPNAKIYAAVIGALAAGLIAMVVKIVSTPKNRG
ncbi:MAG: hypothetical protein LBK53_08875 [Heliobacteriaceae bacterium]|nr:hypothetical protein [Heliobacteriaceae bacterium]